MSRRGHCCDNAVAESFFSSLKKERIKKHVDKNRDLATNDISDYIESFYNRTLRHSHVGEVSPEEFEAAEGFSLVSVSACMPTGRPERAHALPARAAPT